MSVQSQLPQKSDVDYAAINKQLRALIDEPSLSETSDLVGSRGHARAGRLDLSAAISAIPDQAQLQDVEVYADTLTTTSEISLAKRVDTLTIFARQIIVNDHVTFTLRGDVLITISCSGSCCPFKVVLNTPKGQEAVSVDVPYDAQAFDIEVDAEDWSVKTRIVRDQLAVSPFFDVPTLTDRILDNGQLASRGIDKMNENLPRLLRYQLLLAASWQQRDPKSSFDIGTFVAKMTQKVPAAFELYARASSFVTTCVVNTTEQIASQVPIIAVSSAKQILESRLMAAKAFDDAFRDLKGQQANAANAILSANLALQASEDADEHYAFLANLAQTRFDAARKSLQDAKETFRLLQEDIPAVQKAFQEGIKKWRIKQIAEVVIKGISAIVLIAGTIAATCVVPPAGVAIGAEVVELPVIAEEAAQGVETVRKMVTIMNRLKTLFERLKPALSKVGDLVEKIQAILAIMRKMTKIDGAESGLVKDLNMPVGQGDDVINLAADWDSFGAEMASMSEPVKSEQIEGASDFFLLINKMVLRGKAILAAQQAVTVTGDVYATSLSQQLMSNRQVVRLRAAIPLISGDPSILRLVKLSLFERLLSVRLSIIMDIKQYIDGISWFALDSPAVVRLDSLKDIGDFFNDAAVLQATVSQAAATMRPQSRTFCLSTATAAEANSTGSFAASGTAPAALSTGGNFPQSFKETGKATLSIDPTLQCFIGVGRVRLSSFKIFLDGIEAGSTPLVALRVRLGEGMSDLSVVATDSVDSIGSVNAGRVLHFSTAVMTLGFAYVPGRDQHAVVLAGQISDMAARPSPFRQWDVSVAKGTDLKRVTDIRMEIVCDVTVGGF